MLKNIWFFFKNFSAINMFMRVLSNWQSLDFKILKIHDMSKYKNELICLGSLFKYNSVDYNELSENTLDFIKINRVKNKLDLHELFGMVHIFGICLFGKLKKIKK